MDRGTVPFSMAYSSIVDPLVKKYRVDINKIISMLSGELVAALKISKSKAKKLAILHIIDDICIRDRISEILDDVHKWPVLQEMIRLADQEKEKRRIVSRDLCGND